MSDKKDIPLQLSRRTATTSGAVYDEILRSYVAKPDTGKSNDESVNMSDLLNASDTVTSQCKTYDVLKQILPDIEVTESVTTTGILFSKSNQTLEFVYTAASDILGSKVVDTLNSAVKSHFTGILKIERDLKDIVAKALYRQGSYPIMLLPEGTIEATLKQYSSNYSNESHKESITDIVKKQIMSILDGKNKSSYSSESYFDKNYEIKEPNATTSITPLSKLNLIMTYNVDVLKIPTLNEFLTKKHLETESLNNNSASRSAATKRIEKIQSRLNERKTNKVIPTLDLFEMKKMSDKSFGHPIRTNMPPESVIPILSPMGDSVISYLIILDNQCNPIRNSLSTDQYREISNNLRSGNPAYAQIQTRLQNAGFTDRDVTQIGQAQDLKRIWNFYSQKFEETMRSEIEQGVATGNVKFRADDSTYRLMFSRLLQGLQTRILCVPPDLITYIAFDKNEYGIGVSLVEKNKITGYLRANLQLAYAAGALQNSINHKSIDIELDPADGNPKRTVATLVSNVTSLDTNSIPTLMAGSPTELLQHVSRSGYSINVTGNNKKYPQTKCSVSDKGRNVVRPDTEYTDSLRRTHISSLWSTPEAIDSALQGELATAIIINNAINTERYNMANITLCEFMSQHIVQYINNSSILINALGSIINDHITEIGPKYKDYLGDESPSDVARKEDPEKEDLTKNISNILEVYLATFAVELPKPDSGSIRDQSDNISVLISSIDAVLDVLFNEDMGYGLGKDKMQEEIKLLRATIKSREVQKWAKETGYLKDIFSIDLTTKDSATIESIVAGLSSTPNAILSIAVKLAASMLEEQKELTADSEVVINDKNSLGGGNDGFSDKDDSEPGDGADGDEVPDLPDTDEGEGDDTLPSDDSDTTSDEESPPELPDSDTDENDSDVKPESDDKVEDKVDDKETDDSDEPPELPDDKK